MTNLSFRKDNYIKTASGLIGKVTSVKNLYVTLWDGKIEHTIDRGDVVARVSAKEAKSLQNNPVAHKQPNTKVVVKPTKTETAEKSPTKKDLAIALYNDVRGEDKPRAAFMTRRYEIGLSKAGASTYYQNIASGKEGWTK